jgi:uncharacterized protein (TIGR02217 family)
MYSTTMTEDEIGSDSSNSNWSEALWEFHVKFRRGSAEFGQALGFWLARRGPAFGFFFQDPFDFTDSDHDGVGLVRTFEDGKRYLCKRYPDSYSPYHRIIRCPINLVMSGVGGTPVFNYETGEVTGAATDGTATFQYVNPVKFKTDLAEFERDPAIGDWINVVLREVRSYRLDDIPDFELPAPE